MQHFTAAIFSALVLFGAATAIGEESRLQLSALKEEIRGTFAISDDQSLEFFAKIHGKHIVSITTFCNLTCIQLTSLKLPVTALHDRKIMHMLEKVLNAAAVTATAFLKSEGLPPISDNIVDYYYQFADALFKQTDKYGSSQLRFSLMYHSAIMGSAKRITDGAKKPSEICTVSAQYYYGNRLFVCIQDLETSMSEETPALSRQKREFWPRDGSPPPTGRHWGCCGNYAGRCRWSTDWCWKHDCVCQCCEPWHCGRGLGCRSEEWCDGDSRYEC